MRHLTGRRARDPPPAALLRPSSTGRPRGRPPPTCARHAARGAPGTPPPPHRERPSHPRPPAPPHRERPRPRWDVPVPTAGAPSPPPLPRRGPSVLPLCPTAVRRTTLFPRSRPRPFPPSRRSHSPAFYPHEVCPSPTSCPFPPGPAKSCVVFGGGLSLPAAAAAVVPPPPPPRRGLQDQQQWRRWL